MNLLKLKHVLALYQEGSFVKAASRVNLTQSALSRSIQSLEQELELTLFERTSHGVVPTATGRQFIERAHELMHTVNGFEHDMRSLRGGISGKLSFGMGPVPSSSYLTEGLVRIVHEFPDLQLSVEINDTATLADHVRSERIEFFIADPRTLGELHEFKITPFAQQIGILCCRANHPLLESNAHKLTDFDIASIYLPPVNFLPQALRALLQPQKRGNTERSPQTLSCDSVEVIKNVVLNSDLLLLTTSSAVQKELANGELVLLPVPEMEQASVAMNVISLSSRSLSPAAAKVIKVLQDISDSLHSK